MNKPTEIKIGRVSANDDTVKIQEWHFQNASKVSAQAILVSLETSKAVFEVDAEIDGYLEIIVPAGTEVPVGTVIGMIHKTPVPKPSAVENAFPTHGITGKLRYSKLALAMLDHHGIDPKEMTVVGNLVRKQDVEAFLGIREEPNSVILDANLKETAIEVSIPVILVPTTTAASPTPIGGFFSDAKKSAKARGKGIVWLALNYFFRNYILGHIARLSPLGINIWIHKLRGVKIGKGVYIDPSATIETAYPENVTIGNDVRITANAIIMTHIKAPHALRDQGIIPLVMQPVILEDHCFIGVNAVIMPGVTIGRGAVVTSGSVVLSNVPESVMVTGNPAKIVKRLTPVQNGKQHP